VLTQLLYDRAAEDPDHTALVSSDERLSRAELIDRVERLAGGLAERGIGPGDAVALVLRADPWFVASVHAITALGAKVVPTNPAYKQAELEFCFRSVGVRAVISDERTAGVCERIAAGLDPPAEVIVSGPGHGQSLTLADLVERGSPGRLEPRAPEEPFVGQFSSGTTGLPKRLDRTHGQCRAEADAYLGLGIGPEDRILAMVPLFHDWGMGSCVLASAASGATLVILEDRHPFLLRRHRALQLIEEEGVTVLPGVPLNYRLMAESPTGADLSSLRLCFSAGTALPRETFEGFGERFGALVRQLYGSTETGMIAANMSADPLATSDSVGTAVDGVRIEIVDEEGEPLPVGETGEVTVASPSATDGYGDLEELNRIAFRDGSYFTGDLGRLDEDGMLYLTGRKKRLIELAGFKVDPVEVETVIDSHPAVREAVVVGVESGRPGEQRAKAVVVPDDECEEGELLSYCRERLANFKVPQEVEFREEIPKSPMGKVLRKYLV
jgi:long-chain acyl-CoA synthetase